MSAYTNRKIRSPDGEVLHLISTIIDNPVACLLLVHGIGEHSGRYEELFNYLGEQNIACRSFDLRGHGKSSGKRGHVASYDKFMQDIALNLSELKKEFPHLPIFLYGHSMGGNLILNYGLRHPKEHLHGYIATSPWLGLAFNPPRYKKFLAKLMTALWPGYQDSNELDPKHLSHDPNVAQEYRQDTLVHNKITAGLYTALEEAAVFAMEHAEEFPLPLLLIHGKDDPITSPADTRKFGEKAGKIAELHLFDDMYHETHHETDRQEVFDCVTNWVKKHL